MPGIDFVAITAAYNWEPYLALRPVIATEGDLAAGDRSVGLGPCAHGMVHPKDEIAFRVSENPPILLANLLQSSSSTFSYVSFPSFFAFQEGIWDTQIAALLSSPTVTPDYLRPNEEIVRLSFYSQRLYRPTDTK
jgi:hypothetical protein